MFGFGSVKDILEVILVPAIGGLVVLLWTSLQAFDKRRRFERLIACELEEIGLHPKEQPPGEFTWTKHQTKTFFHQRILNDSSANRDFILSLNPTLIYLITQIWEARRTGDSVQWLWYLEYLSKRYGGKVSKAYAEWKELLGPTNDAI